MDNTDKVFVIILYKENFLYLVSIKLDASNNNLINNNYIKWKIA